MGIDADAVTASQVMLHTDPKARLFFRTILGGAQTADGWRCPSRGRPPQEVVLRVHRYLEDKGWAVRLVGEADRVVLREIERRRSFGRTNQAAREFREQPTGLGEEARRGLLEFGWDEGSRKLLPHQERAVEHGIRSINLANFSVPGAGKTASTLALAALHMRSGTVQLVVVVGPLASFGPWERETAIALPGRLRPRRVRGQGANRRAVYNDARPLDLLLVSYASAAADRDALIDLCARFDVMLVVDESHRIKRFRGGLWAPALMAIAERARVRVILSGTPMPQNGRDLYSQLNVLWPRGDLTGSRDHFAVRVDRDFSGLLRDVLPFVARTSKPELGLPPYSVQRHEVDMPPLQEEVYRLIESRLRQQVLGSERWPEMIAALRRGRPIRLLQAAANPALLMRRDAALRVPRVPAPSPTLLDRLANYSEEEVPAKWELGVEILREIAARREKAVCWTNFIGNLDGFRSFAEARLDARCFQVDGRVPTGDDADDDGAERASPSPAGGETRERIIERFLSTDGPAVLITNPASCSESISLHRSCRNAIYLDRTYDCALFLQSIDRIHRLGLPQDARVSVHLLMSRCAERDTIDQLIDRSLEAKADDMRRLLEGAELAPLNGSSNAADDAEGDERDLGALLRYLLGEPARTG